MIVGLWKRHNILRDTNEGGGGGQDGVDSGQMVDVDPDDAGGVDGAGGTGDNGQAEPTYEQLTAQAKELADKAEALRVSKLTDEEKAAEDKAKTEAEEAAKANHAPEEYADFKMPKDTPVDEALLNDFKPLAKELDLPQDKAQKLIDLYAEKVAPLMVQRQTETWNNQLETWKQECKTDKEIGGDKFDAAVLDAKRVINTIGTPELKKVFDDYGLGNNPELVRVFSRMAKYMKEDTVETGRASAQTDIAKKFYPDNP